ncbi:DUF6527 family protein [Pseudomonas sp. LFM046]|uniref:DUF6527 family protein n=1 Tax=Pseudomonas sp. LFM046 TaxID=1608357 RepID=UPI0005CFAEA3|nr:DUF6527 family protein [Pseudomonas sp. LFM046]
MTGFVRLSAVLKQGQAGTLFFHCPGCDGLHGVRIGVGAGPRWDWDGNVHRPTFSPSVLVRTGRAVDPSFVPEPGDPPEVCHSFVRGGQIQFLDDCTHALAGKTVDLPVLPEEGARWDG